MKKLLLILLIGFSQIAIAQETSITSKSYKMASWDVNKSTYVKDKSYKAKNISREHMEIIFTDDYIVIKHMGKVMLDVGWKMLEKQSSSVESWFVTDDGHRMILEYKNKYTLELLWYTGWSEQLNRYKHLQVFGKIKGFN